MVFSKTDERCTKCPYFDDCNNKRLVACAFMPNMGFEAGISAGINAAQPFLRQEVKTNLGMVYKDDLQKEIEKQLYKQLQCPFNYGLS